jgi:spore coat polysaccharide biosynthesis predicted glycosyltransferase SpsG
MTQVHKDATPAQVRRYEILFKKNLEKEEKYIMEKSKAFRLIMGQCSTAMRNKLESLNEYPQLEKDDNIIGLLSKMNELVYSTGNVQYEYWVMQSAVTKLVTLHQRRAIVSRG